MVKVNQAETSKAWLRLEMRQQNQEYLKFKKYKQIKCMHKKTIKRKNLRRNLKFLLLKERKKMKQKVKQKLLFHLNLSIFRLYKTK